ncbi:MAG: PTS system mannose/fructose/sorbose family transporter subunit IID [Lachnospiraceae bacterium]|nr:PTS system mannose/fructose/sorbose family transporter subunit IID [Lachnospiraceae bacterium]
MELHIWQIVLIALYYCLGESAWPFGSMGTWATVNRPLVSGLVVGLILGDPVTGTIIGATINIMYLGIISAGGSLPSDSGMAGVLGTAFALIGGLDVNAALALAVPLGLFGSVLWILTMTAQCFCIPLADKWVEENKPNRLMLINLWIPYAIKWVIRFIFVYVVLYFGSDAVVKVCEMLEGPAMDALGVMGGLLPAVGIGLMLLTIFKGNARYFLLLGFLATSFLGLNTIAVALTFGIIAILIVGFTPEDFEAFKNVEDTNDTAYKLISKKDLVRSWVRWEYYNESCYNYERMQGLGFCTAMVPVLNKIYAGDAEGMKGALKRHIMFFNTDHNFGGMILGICTSMEEQKKLGADIPDEAFVSLKSGLMGPCAGIGDTLSQVVLLPTLAVIFINLAQKGAVWAPIAYTVLFVGIFYSVGYWMLFVGYKNGGEAVLKLMEGGLFDKVIKVANILGCAVAGALICSYVSFNWNVIMMKEEVEMFNLQTGVFDAILPNAMPLVLTMGIYYAAKKGVKSSYITFGVMIIGFILGILGLIA